MLAQIMILMTCGRRGRINIDSSTRRTKSAGKKTSPRITSQSVRHVHRRDYLKQKAALADDQLRS